MNKLVEWKERLKKGHMFSVIMVLLAIVLVLGILLYQKQREYRQLSENSYNMAFYELVDYVQNIEIYLVKSLISTTPEHGIETFTHIWREANLAQSYLARLPISSNELENTEKFLNQVSEYSYTLSQKNINGESLSEEDLNNLEELHGYSEELEKILNQLSNELNSGNIKWGELENKGSIVFSENTNNMNSEIFSNIEQNFHEYVGLIYDGAYSDHLINNEKVGLTGEEISEDIAKQKVEEFIGSENISEIKNKGYSENGNIQVYVFEIIHKDDEITNISISKIGGHVVNMNSNRDVNEEVISQEEAKERGKIFLESKGYGNIEATYYIKQSGILTINYASVQDDIILYPDLIKVKVALDTGEILGIETTGYLNNHEVREFSNIRISQEEAKSNINKELEIVSERIALIPTKYKTEVLCYEFQGIVDGREFLVYINVENGKEEDILIITNTGEGILAL